MTMRTLRKHVTFPKPFLLRTLDAVLPAGVYKIDTEEELIDGLSFLAYRRIATWIHLPSIGTKTGCGQMVLVQPSELEGGSESTQETAEGPTRHAQSGW